LLFREGQFIDYIEENTVVPGTYYPVASLQNSGHEVRFTTMLNPKKLEIPSARERQKIRGTRRGFRGGHRGGFRRAEFEDAEGLFGEEE
jgi:hypothetical protein